MSDQDNLDYTTTACGKCGLAPKEQHDMVGCDCCDAWYHYTCVGVTAAVQEEEKWYCHEAACRAADAEYQKQKKITNPEDSDDEKIKAMKAELLRRDQEMAKQLKTKDKLLELEMALKKQKFQHEQLLRQKQYQQEEELRQFELKERDRENQKRLQSKKAHLERLQKLSEDFNQQMSAVEQQLEKMKLAPNPDEASSSRKAGKKDDNEDEDSEVSDSSDEQSSDEGGGDTTPVKPVVKKMMAVPDGLERKRTGPTKAQLAARHGIGKHLPQFSGKPDDWPLFYAAYRSTTEACGFSDIDNLARLQQCLKGDALELVRGQLLLPKTVPRVIEKLRQNFGRPEQLLARLLDRVNELPAPKNLKGFIPFANVVEQLCDHIEAAELKEHLRNPLLIKELVKKLPDAEKRQWAEVKRARGKRTISLRTITDFLLQIADDAREAEVDFVQAAGSKVPAGQPSKEKVKQSGRMYLHSEVDSANESDDSTTRRLKSCKACQRTGHGLRFCNDFKDMSYADRAQLVSRERLCKVCLNGHGGQCRANIQCDIGDCREPHNPLLHPIEADATGLSAHIRTGNDVLFRIVPVQLHCGERTVEVLAFLDEGASVTLMESKLADRLALDGVPEKLTLKWTGSVSRVESQSRRMNVWASAVGGEGKLLLNTVRTVSKLLLPRQKMDAEELSAQYEHVRGLPIHSYDGQPEMIIGLNNIHAFAPIESKAGPYMGEPIAVRCKLGWSIYGPRQLDTMTTYLGYHRVDAEQHNSRRPPKMEAEEIAASPQVSVVVASKKSVAAERQEDSGERKRATKLAATAKHEPARKTGALHRCSIGDAERAEGAASAGSVSSGHEPSKLPVDEKVQLLDGGAKLTNGNRRMVKVIPNSGKQRRGMKCLSKSGTSDRRSDVTGWSLLPRTNGQFEPLELHSTLALAHNSHQLGIPSRRSTNSSSSAPTGKAAIAIVYEPKQTTKNALSK